MQGFRLKGTKRKHLIDGTSDEHDDLVNDEGVESANLIKKPLVIPLANPREKSIATNTALSLDERAAAELIDDLRNPSDKNSTSNLIIAPVQQNSAANLPILMAATAPELNGITDDSERFKVDLSLRADDVSFKSTSYKSVPIEEFGAALLRGMGWEGPTEDDEARMKRLSEPLFKRETNLGLGARAKPKTGGKSSTKNDIVEKSKNEWAQKAESRLLAQNLQEGDIVWIRDPKYVGLRGLVAQVKGVPGLNKIR